MSLASIGLVESLIIISSELEFTSLRLLVNESSVSSEGLLMWTSGIWIIEASSFGYCNYGKNLAV